MQEKNSSNMLAGAIFFLLISSFILVIGSFIPEEKNSNYYSKEGNLISGFVVHTLHSDFDAPINGFKEVNNRISVKDTAIYKTGWYSVDGTTWQNFTLEGASYTNSNWIRGLASKTLPMFGYGEHYVIIYSCTYANGSWDCHDNNWQLKVIDNANSSCSDGIQNGEEMGVDCGGKCKDCIDSADYYVSPTGSDDNDGSFGAPFATWCKLNEVMQPGDLAYIRGGQYTNFSSEKYQCLIDGLNGTQDNPIKIWAYPGETPIWNLSEASLPDNTPYLMAVRNSNYIHFKGLRITGAEQPGTSPVIGWHLWQSSNNIIENCVLDNIGGFGFMIHGVWWDDVEGVNTSISSGNTFLNCDAYAIADPSSPSPYDGSNGFSIVHTTKIRDTVFRGCRAWYVSDDGWDFYNSNSINTTIENCWSFFNGYLENGTPVSASEGFKLGPAYNGTATSMINTPTITVMNSISAGNLNGSGFAVYGETGKLKFYNNFAYDNNYIGFFLDGTLGTIHEFKNNIAYQNGDGGYLSQTSDHTGTYQYWIQQKNVWDKDSRFVNNLHLNLTDEDFESLNVSQLMSPRKPNGELPDVSFGNLVNSSPMINSGVDVGLSYAGGSADIGPFEYVSQVCDGANNQSCNISNGYGYQNRTCNFGTWTNWGTCSLSGCNSGYTACGNGCNVSYRSCSVAYGTGNQSGNCSAGSWVWNSCSVVSCNSGFTPCGSGCNSSYRSCAVVNGTGNQSGYCLNNSWQWNSSCTVVSCNSGYSICGAGCNVSYRSCAVANGTGSQNGYCSNNSWLWNSTCTIVSCNTGYTSNGTACVQVNSSFGNRTTFAVNHSHTNISAIPSSCIQNAIDELHVAYSYTSHGSQIYDGINAVERYNSFYSNSPTGSATELHFEGYYGYHDETDDSGFGLGAGYCYDLSSCDDGGQGILHPTRDFLDIERGQSINVIMWSWCAISGHNIPFYLDKMQTLMIEYGNGSAEHPVPVTFVFMTGHVEGTGVAGASNTANTRIRSFIFNQSPGAFCKVNQCILFDFADIEEYDPNNNYYLNRSVNENLAYSGGNWGTDYLGLYPLGRHANITSKVTSCAHSNSPPGANLNCALKGQAAWYMFARIAGWDGVSATCD